jgi:replicative DNA helicase
VAFRFYRDFQIKILALMHQDFDFLIATHELVLPEYFSDEILCWYFLAIRNHYMDYQMRMGQDALRNELLKAAGRKKIKDADFPAYAQVFTTMLEPVHDKKYIQNEVLKFCRHQAIKAAVLKSPQLLQDDKFDEIESTMVEAVRTGSNVADIGELYFINWPERLKRRAIEESTLIIPTGITGLDILLGGGIHGGQVGLWMAPTNRGKSAALGHCGKRAIIQRKKVLHFTMEMPQDEVCGRYDATFTKINMRDLLDMEGQVAEKLERYGHRWGNCLIVKGYPTKTASVQTLRSHIFQCCALGFEPDLILVDYLDLLKPPRSYKEKRDELTSTTEALKGLALELKRGIWTGTQSQRAAISMETHTEENVSEDIGKINNVDIAITMNQTKEEVRQKVMRLLLAKNRNGPKYETVTIKMALERMCFFELVGPVFVNPPTSLTTPAKHVKRQPYKLT